MACLHVRRAVNDDHESKIHGIMSVSEDGMLAWQTIKKSGRTGRGGSHGITGDHNTG